MRIRKNAGRSVDEEEKKKKNNRTSYLICQLNLPPWHDHSFFTLGHWDNDLPINISSSSNDSLPTSHSVDLSVGFGLERENGRDKMLVDGGIGAGSRDTPPVALPTPANTVLPKKRGRPKKVAPDVSAGNSNNNNNNNNNINTNTNCNGNGNGNDNNPYEFYYYSGFGPSWSKRRGETKFSSGPCSIVNGNGNGNGNSEDNIIITDDDENNNTLKSDKKDDHIIQSFGSVASAIQELDYIEDEEDEEEWYGGKRARKPIKARSLKSLM